jgi:hypothetical protein
MFNDLLLIVQLLFHLKQGGRKPKCRTKGRKITPTPHNMNQGKTNKNPPSSDRNSRCCLLQIIIQLDNNPTASSSQLYLHCCVPIKANNYE